MHWAPSRSYHVENYKLTLHFAQSRGEVFGDDVVTVRPFEANFNRFCFDSEDLTIESVTLVKAGGVPEALAYRTDHRCLWITLGHACGPADSLDIRIVCYRSAKAGLYFVNPGRSGRTAADLHAGRARIQPSLVPVLGLSQRHGHQ